MATLLGWLAGGRGVTPSMTACQYPMAPGALERDRLYQHKVSLVVRYFMIPCNICLILLATSTLGFAVLLFLNNCRCPWSRGGQGRWRLGGSRCCQRGFSRGSSLRWGRSRRCQLPARLCPAFPCRMLAQSCEGGRAWASPAPTCCCSHPESRRAGAGEPGGGEDLGRAGGR